MQTNNWRRGTTFGWIRHGLTDKAPAPGRRLATGYARSKQRLQRAAHLDLVPLLVLGRCIQLGHWNGVRWVPIARHRATGTSPAVGSIQATVYHRTSQPTGRFNVGFAAANIHRVPSARQVIRTARCRVPVGCSVAPSAPGRTRPSASGSTRRQGQDSTDSAGSRSKQVTACPNSG